jgi:pimeloyl-ACP methyl ester carboxylesterase
MKRFLVTALILAALWAAPVHAQHSAEDAMILIHGLGSSADVWDQMLPDLSRAYHVWTWEMPGHGRTTPIPNASVETFTAELRRYVEENAIRRPTLVGHGIGGMIALQYAFDHPTEVGRVIVIDAAARQLADLEQKTYVAKQLASNYDRFIANYFQQLCPDEAITDRIIDQALRTDQITLTQLLISTFDYDLTDEIERQSVPILLIGSVLLFPSQESIPGRLAQMGFGKARSISYKAMESVGHFVMLEQPRYTASVILAFGLGATE